MHTPKFFLLTGVFLLLLHTVCTGQEARDTNNNRSETMGQSNEYLPSVESLTPYQSAAAYFKTRLGEDETIKLVFTINSPAESYAIMIKRTLEDNPEYGITITMTPRYKPDITRENVHQLKNHRLYSFG